MIWIIAKKEFLNNIVTPMFIVGLLLCLALIPYTVFTGIKTYENRLIQYENDIKSAEDVYMKSQVYAQVNPIIVKPVSPLSIFSKGIIEQTGSKVRLDRKEKPVFSSDVVQLNENPFMGNSVSLDFVTALTILLSLLGILFSYDMLSREKEQGTLKLSFSFSLSRSTFFLGKLTGIFLTLLPIIIICFLIILIIIQFSPSVHFSVSDYWRIGILILMSLIYFAFFVLLGGYISSRTKTSTLSIIINLFIWCSLLFLLPNAAGYLGKNITKVEDYKQLTFNTQQIDREFWEKYDEFNKILIDEGYNPTWDLSMVGNGDWDGPYTMFFTMRWVMEAQRRFKELANPVLFANCDRKWSLQSDYLLQVYRQEKTVRYFSFISPAEIFKQLSVLLCNTGMENEISFMNQVRQFQDVYYGYYVQNKIYSSYAYMTPQKEEDFPENREEAEAQQNEWRNTAKPESSFDTSSFGYLDTSDLPRFVYVQATLGNDLKSQMYLLAGIIMVCFLLFWFSFVSFIKYDVR